MTEWVILTERQLSELVEDGFCDQCGHPALVRRLSLAGGAGIHLCYTCWNLEMIRRFKLIKLEGQDWSIIGWDEAQCSTCLGSVNECECQKGDNHEHSMG